MIVTLCGSMKFFPQMLEVAAEETVRGRIVLAPFVLVHEPDQGSALKTELDILHRRKILMSSHIIVVTDQFRYMGSSTLLEMEFAAAYGKTLEIRPRFVEGRVNPDTGKIDTMEDYRARRLDTRLPGNGLHEQGESSLAASIDTTGVADASSGRAPTLE